MWAADHHQEIAELLRELAAEVGSLIRADRRGSGGRIRWQMAHW
jgi:hypothetical protein